MTEAVASHLADDLTDAQRELWRPFIDKSVEPESGWYDGWCPRCSPRASSRRSGRSMHTAEVNFRLRKFRCLGDGMCSGGKDEYARGSIPLREPEAWLSGYKNHRDMVERLRKLRHQEAERKAKLRDRAKQDREKQQAKLDKERAARATERAERERVRAEGIAARDATIKALRTKHPRVNKEFLPVRGMADLAMLYLDPSIAPTPDGWWAGWCPLHQERPPKKMDAVFNFKNGSYRCQHEPSCHAPKKAMSLNNLKARTVSGG